MHIKNQIITRHGNFLSSLNINKEEIKNKVLKILTNTELKKFNEEEKNILKDIKFSFENLNQDDLFFINKSDKLNKFSLTIQELNWLSKNPQNKWIKYLIYRYKFKIYPKKKIVTNFPQYILIEPTSICNLRCIMCFQVDKSFSSNKKYLGYMELDLFKKIIEQAKENQCNAITLASRGEPTLHKNFDQLSKMLHDSHLLDCKLNTNATMLDEKKINEILSANFSEVIFSVDAGTKETYEKIRYKGKFNKVVDNIKLFNKIRDKNYKKSNTVTRIAGVKILEEQDLDQMERFWSNLVDEVSIKSASERWDSYNNKINSIKDPCMNLWTRMYVWYDGTVNPCDFDYKSFLAVGNANDHPLKEIWKNKKYNQLRQDHLNSLRSKHNPCDRCPITD
jgi:radical SAM protein with 4Fe4S-binding SPASM domain